MVMAGCKCVSVASVRQCTSRRCRLVFGRRGGNVGKNAARNYRAFYQVTGINFTRLFMARHYPDLTVRINGNGGGSGGERLAISRRLPILVRRRVRPNVQPWKNHQRIGLYIHRLKDYAGFTYDRPTESRNGSYRPPLRRTLLRKVQKKYIYIYSPATRREEWMDGMCSRRKN